MKDKKEVAWRLIRTGKSYMEQRPHAKALKCFNRALGIDPENFEAWICQGKALMKLNRNLEALKSFDCALVIEKKSIYAWILKAQALRMLKQFKQEKECYEKVKEINPSFEISSE